MRLKPGWYLLFATALYALLVTLAWRRCVHQPPPPPEPREEAVAEPAPPPPPAPTKAEEPPPAYVLPLPGACVPKDPDHLPNAPRDYRNGVSYGFVFTGDDACVPVVYGTGVIASARGEVIKADHDHRPLSMEDFLKLLAEVRRGANPEQMDLLRGREVWIRHPDGLVSVYAHLSGIAPQVRVGARVRRGDWIGYVGNSGTELEVRGTRHGARLLFELWRGEVGRGSYFGKGLDAKAVRARARRFFERLPDQED